MLYNTCMGIYKSGNNIYPHRIRRGSNLGHIFREKKSASYGPGNTVNSFHCLGNMIGYEKEVHIDNKLNNHFKITGIINNKFRPQKNFKENKNKTIRYINSSSCVTR